MFILGKKQGMTQMFDGMGRVIPITVIQAPAGEIKEIKTSEKNGYNAIQVKFGKSLKEFRMSGDELRQKKIGDKVTVQDFKKGDEVKVSGLSIGKGFQGVVKRHGFSGGPKSHGHKHVLRTGGSIGSAFPQHVRKGRKMPGRTGNVRITVKGLQVVYVDTENDLLAVKGAVPGKKGNPVIIYKLVKR